MKDKKPHKLDDYGKEPVFKTPQRYFEDLEARIMSRIEEGEEKKVFRLRSPGTKMWIGAAAAVIAILVLSLSQLLSPAAPSVDEMLAEIPAEDCLAYLKGSDIDISDILAISDLEGLVDEYEGGLLPEENLNEEDVDLLYERYGVTDDDKLQTL